MMKWTSIVVAMSLSVAHAQPSSREKQSLQREEAEYYVSAYSQHYGVSPELVRAVIEQESHWNRLAISNKGALGYMQLMPKTAEEYGVNDAFDPSQNIGGGVHYLADLIKEFDGDLRLVLAAYNCGSRRIVARGLEYRNPDVFQYVKQIRRRYEAEIMKSAYLARSLESQEITTQSTLEAQASQEGQL